MSTATIDPPEVKTTPTPEDRKAFGLSMLRPKVQVDGMIPAVQEPEKKVDPEPVKTEVAKVDEKVVTPPVDPREANLGELRKMRDEERKKNEELTKQWEAEKAERTKLLTEYEEFKKQPAPKEFLEKLTKSEQEKERLDQELRATSVERSSYYKENFTDPINAHATVMRDVMVQSGVTPAEANKMIGEWNEESFVQSTQGMSPVQEIKFKAAWMETMRLDVARREVLSKSDEHYKKMQQQQQEQAKLQQEQGQQFLKAEQDALFRELGEQEHLKGNIELLKAARESVDASYQMPPRELMRHVATARLLAEGVKIKDAEIAKLKTEFEELKKKHDEQAEFIKSRNGGTPRVSATDAAEKPEDKKARAAAFLNPTFGG